MDWYYEQTKQNMENIIAFMEELKEQNIQLKKEMVELKESFENEKIKNNILMEKHKDQICKFTNVISKLTFYTPNAINNSHIVDITTKEIKVNEYWRIGPFIKQLYKLEKLHLKNTDCRINFEKVSNEFVTTLIIESFRTNEYGDSLTLANLHALPSLNKIEFHDIISINVDDFIRSLSSYQHKIEIITFTNCPSLKIYTPTFHNLKTYCDENNIKLEF